MNVAKESNRSSRNEISVEELLAIRHTISPRTPSPSQSARSSTTQMATGTNFGRTFRPPSYLRGRAVPVRHPAIAGRAAHMGHPRLRRTASNSSIISATSDFSAPPSPSWAEHSDGEEQQFIMSGTNTPLNENPPPSHGTHGDNIISPNRNRLSANSYRGGRPPPARFPDDEDWTVPHYKERLTVSNRHHHGPQELAQQQRLKSEPITTSNPFSLSRPIAIELPTVRKLTSAPTPPEPLSARGDLPGGYFPNHEDPTTRIHRPHPFQPDVNKAKAHSIQRATESITIGESTLSAQPLVPRLPSSSFVPNQKSTGHNQMAPPANSLQRPRSLSHAKTGTPVSSYLPSGAHDVPLPMGKYYPSNYEKRSSSHRANRMPLPDAGRSEQHNNRHSQTLNLVRSSKSPVPSISVGAKLESEPTICNDRQNLTNTSQTCQLQLVLPIRSPSPSPSSLPPPCPQSPLRTNRDSSEAKRRLQQYQRDMIAQARMAANGLLQQPGGSGMTSASLRGLPIKHLSLDGTLPMLGGKPVSPRLAPLGSPTGPVTPMELGGGGGDYLGKGRVELKSPVDLPDDRMTKVEERAARLAFSFEEQPLSRVEIERRRRRAERSKRQGESADSTPSDL